MTDLTLCELQDETIDYLLGMQLDDKRAYFHKLIETYYPDALDDEFEYEYEDDKSYASIPQQTQTYAAPAAAISPEMAEAMEKFSFWTQEEIQGYFDQGWSVQQLEEWLENQ